MTKAQMTRRTNKCGLFHGLFRLADDPGKFCRVLVTEELTTFGLRRPQITGGLPGRPLVGFQFALLGEVFAAFDGPELLPDLQDDAAVGDEERIAR